MKKTIGACVCALTLMGLVGQAEAAPINDWNFKLSEVTFDTSNSTTSSNGAGINSNGESKIVANKQYDLGWDGSRRYHEIFASTSSTGSFELIGNYDDGASKTPSSSTLASYSTIAYNGTNSSYAKNGHLAIMSMTFELTSGVESFAVTYNVPLKIFTDGASEYIYYNPSDVFFTGGVNSAIINDYEYTMDISSLKLGGKAQGDVPFIDFDAWYITNYGLNFNMTADLNMSYSYAGEGPAPTPEPATMLLMGLGLAGLGFVARRRNSK